MGKIAKGNEEDVNKAVDAADKVYLEFRHSSVEERRELLDKIVKEYQNRKNDLIEAITDELGAPLSVSENVHYQMGLNHFTAARDALDSFNLKNNVAMIWLLKKQLELLDLLHLGISLQTKLHLN